MQGKNGYITNNKAKWITISNLNSKLIDRNYLINKKFKSATNVKSMVISDDSKFDMRTDGDLTTCP